MYLNIFIIKYLKNIFNTFVMVSKCFLSFGFWSFQNIPNEPLITPNSMSIC